MGYYMNLLELLHLSTTMASVKITLKGFTVGFMVWKEKFWYESVSIQSLDSKLPEETWSVSNGICNDWGRFWCLSGFVKQRHLVVHMMSLYQ